MPAARTDAGSDRIVHPGVVHARIVGLLCAATLLAACGGRGGERPGVPGGRQAALARLLVDNQTRWPLDIAFRYAVPQSARVTVGRAAPRTTTEMAPVPAGEPIILIALGSGFTLRLEPRSLEIGQTWTWVIRNDSTAHEP